MKANAKKRDTESKIDELYYRAYWARVVYLEHTDDKPSNIFFKSKTDERAIYLKKEWDECEAAYQSELINISK